LQRTLTWESQVGSAAGHPATSRQWPDTAKALCRGIELNELFLGGIRTTSPDRTGNFFALGPMLKISLPSTMQKNLLGVVMLVQ